MTPPSSAHDGSSAREVREATRLPGTAAIALLVVALLVPIPGRFSAPWIGSLQDFCHVPLFAILSWLFSRVAGGAMAGAALAFGLAVVIEPIQGLVGRSASFDDVVRGSFGIAIFLCCHWAARLPAAWQRTAACLAAVVLGAAFPVSEAWPTLADALAAWRKFPVLADFSAPSQWRRWKIDDCTLNCRLDAAGASVGVLECGPNVQSTPSIILFPIVRDWSRYRWLCIDFELDGDALPMTFAVRDGRRVTAPRHRFELSDTYDRGRHAVRIDLSKIAQGSSDIAAVDVDAIQSFHIIVDPQGRRRVVRLDRIWLE